MLEPSAKSTEYMRRSSMGLGVPESRLARLVPADLRDAFAADEWDELRLKEATMRGQMPGTAEFMAVPALRAAFRRH